MEDEDGRREEAIASVPPLQPNFKPVGVSQSQLTKFQELHKRRLQIKAKSNIKKKSKGSFQLWFVNFYFVGALSSSYRTFVGISGGTSKSHGKHSDAKDCKHGTSSNTTEDLRVSISEENNMQQQNVAAGCAPKMRQKLHWGLDTKERWERKANM